MLQISFQWITGMMLGIEFITKDDIVDSNDVSFGIVFDLLILRVVLSFYKLPPPESPA